MHWKRILWSIVIILGCAFLAYFGTIYFVNSDIRQLTVNLPPLDRVEIESVSLRGETIDKVLDEKILLGTNTETLRNLWRSQNYAYGEHIMCHEPGYRIRFYVNNTLITEATICFRCDNIYFYKYAGAINSGEYMEAVFDANDSSGKKLRVYLSNLFPGHDKEAPSS